MTTEKQIVKRLWQQMRKDDSVWQWENRTFHAVIDGMELDLSLTIDSLPEWPDEYNYRLTIKSDEGLLVLQNRETFIGVIKSIFAPNPITQMWNHLAKRERKQERQERTCLVAKTS